MQNQNAAKNFPTKYWHILPNGRVQCDLCPQHCKLNPGQRGLCFVRMCENNQIVLTTYGRSSGFAVDPIEKKPFYHFLPGTRAFSFGTAGCNLACKFCQNYDMSKSREMDILAEYATPVMIAKRAQELGCESVAFTYNEPTIFMEYAIDTAIECHKLGIRTVVKTNGYICDEPRTEFYQYIDAASVDLKAYTENFYRSIASAHLQPVLDTLIYLKHKTNVWLEVVTLIIPGENDTAEEIGALTKWIVTNLGIDVPVHFTAFHPAWKMLDKPVTPLETLIRARDIALKNGIRYAYTGNVDYMEGNKTFCHNCHNCVVERTGYVISDYQLDEAGSCRFCGTSCAGIYPKRV
ncbi:MAG: AmmeMemoRadiSam system radical SAM enzyme [Gammaproteobacteria bacterium]|nr:AmmeMemoRadiSam system radical SAM enzyme [Gammaproteobacteria bacterium]